MKPNSYKELFAENGFPLNETDPDFADIFFDFAFEEAAAFGNDDQKSRFLSLLAVLLGTQGLDCFKVMLPAAIEGGLTADEIREVIYQSVAYIGFAKALPFFAAANEYFSENNIPLPKKSEKNTNALESGIAAQVDIFGEGMREFYKSGSPETVHINRWLAENCFGGYYTRKTLDYKERELITFCILAAQGGCEPQLASHTAANIRIGNDKTFLIKIISQCVPFIGYPRTLNALNIIKNA